MKQSRTLEGPDPFVTTGVGGTSYYDLELEVPEGESESLPVDVPYPAEAEEGYITSLIAANVHAALTAEFMGDTPVPVTGACLLRNDAIVLDFGSSVIAEVSTDYIVWEKRQLKGDGTYTTWGPLSDLGPKKGEFVNTILPTEGIYQFRAVLSLPDNTKIPFPLLRMRTAVNPVNGKGETNEHLMAGQEDYVGVCKDQISKTARDVAKDWLGSLTYSFGNNVVIQPNPPTGRFNPMTTNAPKCNIFVAHTVMRAGMQCPFFSRRGFIACAPLARQDFYADPEQNVNLDAYGMEFKGVPDFPYPGMIVASPSGGPNAAGHVGIMDYDGTWINAGTKTVNKYIHISNTPDYTPHTMRALSID